MRNMTLVSKWINDCQRRGRSCHRSAQHVRCIIIKNWRGTHPAIWGDCTMASGGIDAPDWSIHQDHWQTGANRRVPVENFKVSRLSKCSYLKQSVDQQVCQNCNNSFSLQRDYWTCETWKCGTILHCRARHCGISCYEKPNKWFAVLEHLIFKNHKTS